MNKFILLRSILLSATLTAAPNLLGASPVTSDESAETQTNNTPSATVNSNATPKGQLVIVGGALSSSNQVVYQKFIELAGGADQARIAVIPAASGQPVKYFRQFQADLQRYGVAPQRVL